MTRPKVDPDKRQRTAQACDSCKRRKQKVCELPSLPRSRSAAGIIGLFFPECRMEEPPIPVPDIPHPTHPPGLLDSADTPRLQCNGHCPCNTCEKRNLTCTFGSSEPGSADDQSPSKRRLTENDASGFANASIDNGPSPLQSPENHQSPQAQRPSNPSQWALCEEAKESPNNHAIKLEPFRSDMETPSIECAARSVGLLVPKPDESAEASMMSRGTTASAGDEEADNHTMTRLLQDPTGRLCESARSHHPSPCTPWRLRTCDGQSRRANGRAPWLETDR